MEPITLLRSTTAHAARNSCYTVVFVLPEPGGPLPPLRVISREPIRLEFMSLQAAVFVWVARGGPFVYGRGFHSGWKWPEWGFWAEASSPGRCDGSPLPLNAGSGSRRPFV